MRWTFRRKVELVDALRAGTVTATELQRRHGVSAEGTHGVDKSL
jgi:hypothetical protein